MAQQTIEVIDAGPSFWEQALIGVIGGVAGAGGGIVVVRSWLPSHRRELRERIVQLLHDKAYTGATDITATARRVGMLDTLAANRYARHARTMRAISAVKDLEQRAPIGTRDWFRDHGLDRSAFSKRVRDLNERAAAAESLARDTLLRRLERSLSTPGWLSPLWWIQRVLDRRELRRLRKQYDALLATGDLPPLSQGIDASVTHQAERADLPALVLGVPDDEKDAAQFRYWLDRLPPDSVFVAELPPRPSAGGTQVKR